MYRYYIFDPQDNSGVVYRWDGPLTTTIRVLEVSDDGRTVERDAERFEVEPPSYVAPFNGRRVELGLHESDVISMIRDHHAARKAEA